MVKFRIGLWIAVALALAVLGAATVGLLPIGGNQSPTSAAAPGAPLGGPFSLVDHNGAPVTEAIFRDKPSITLFGFTHCPDICPTGLMDMTRWAEELGDDADKLRFIFVTVDPERDTPEIMSDYVSVFSEHIIGITGDPEDVMAMTRDYKIFSRKVPLEDDDYTMDHTASKILHDAEGNFVGTIDAAEPHETGLGKLRRLVAG